MFKLNVPVEQKKPRLPCVYNNNYDFRQTSWNTIIILYSLVTIVHINID